jgi:hypothetical protein
MNGRRLEKSVELDADPEQVWEAIGTEPGIDRFGAEGADGCGVSAYHYFYGEPADADGVTEEWQAWLTSLFPVPAGTADAR